MTKPSHFPPPTGILSAPDSLPAAAGEALPRVWILEDERASRPVKAAESPVFYLDIIPHSGKRWRTALSASTLLVGRSPRCHMVLPDPRVSRLHLRIAHSAHAGVSVIDLFTANGTRFEGHRLRPGHPINWLINQSLQIGDTRLVLRWGIMPA